MRHIAGIIVIAVLIINGSWFHGQPAHAGRMYAGEVHAPLVLAPPSVLVSPGPQAGGTLLGAVLFGSFGSTTTTAADIYLGVVPTNTTPTKNRVYLYQNSSTPSAGVKSGDCWGDWDKTAPNSFAMAYEPASSDRLTVTLSNTRVVSEVNCSLVFSNFTRLVSETHGASTARLVSLMNYFEVSVKRNSANYTSTLSSLTLNDSIALGTFNPITTTTATSRISSFHLGNGFKLAGSINLNGNFGTCAGTCEIEIRFGAAPAQVIVQQQVAGIAPLADWQFNGPNGAFTLPAIGGSAVITPLGSNTYTISQTAKHGFGSSAACSNGSTGSNAVSVTPNAGETITCTFTSNALPSDLAISKTVLSDSVQVGSTITYALVVSNAGAGPAYNAIITDSVPPSLTLVGAQSSLGTCNIAGNDITCNTGFINTLPISAPVTVIVTASTPGDLSAIGMTITNTAGVTDALDATPENNFAERAITLREVDEGKIVVRNIVSGTAPSSGTFAYALQTPGDALPFTLHAGGSITFTGMASGAYGLSATAAMGYSASIECAGNGNGTFTLEAGATVTCTFTHAGTNVIAGTLWHDRNENQQIDADEWRLPHVTIGLSGTLDGGSVSAITTTDSSGVYQFTGLPDGAHGVTVMSETLPSGVITPAYDADGIDTPNIAQTALCCNTPATLNFGYRGDGQVGGRVFYDVNNDGMLDAGDLSLANIVVHLSGDLNNDSTLDVLTATTNSAGSYAFTSILTGVYTLTIDAATLPRVLLPTTSASTVVTLSDTPQLDVNFGYRGTGSIAGFVWEDVNGNGVPDAGEPGLNTSLTLEGDLNRDGVIDARTTKSAGGNYAFDGLAGGIYTITVDQASLLPAMQPIAQTGRVETLAHSESKSGADFGFARPASVQGRIWLDANRNGVMDDGEDGVSGIAISLFDASAASNAITSQSISASPIATITSNDGGEYGFDDLVPGRPYSLHFALPAGFAWVVGNSSAIDGYGNTGVFTVTSGENVVLRMNAGATQPTRLTLHKKTAQTIIGLDERITYTLVIRNAGDTMAAQTTISDPLPGELQFISAEPWPSMPPAEGAPLVWAIGDLPAGQTFTITLMTQLKTEPAPAGNALVNTAYVLADMQTVARTNDLQSSATTVLRPSAITLASFEAMMTGNGVQLAWRTSLEQNTFGFFVLRSATGNRTDALGVNAEIVPAGAGDYALIDADGLISSVYWLQEVELDGSTRDAGPFRVIAPASAAPAPATAMQLAVMMQPQPAMVAVASSQLSAPNVVLEEIELQQTWVQPQVIAPVEPSHPSTPQRSDDEPISTKADAIDETDVPALVPASIGSAQIQSTATATPESEPVMDVRGIAQAVSVQRGNPTPSDTAIQNDTTSDTELPVEALMLLAGIGLTGVLLLLMMFAGRFARKQQPRK